MSASRSASDRQMQTTVSSSTPSTAVRGGESDEEVDGVVLVLVLVLVLALMGVPRRRSLWPAPAPALACGYVYVRSRNGASLRPQRLIAPSCSRRLSSRIASAEAEPGA